MPDVREMPLSDELTAGDVSDTPTADRPTDAVTADRETICAPATIPGTGAISIIRVSGPACLAVADRVVRLRRGKVSDAAGYSLHFGQVFERVAAKADDERGADGTRTPGAVDGIGADGSKDGKTAAVSDDATRTSGAVEGMTKDFPVSNGGDSELVDEVLVSVFRAPHSYTGEDMVEISCHASSYIVQRILSLLCEAGAVPAEAGEFTRRAFVNGKMDLSQAEAVADLIASGSRCAHDLAIKQMKGGYSEELGRMRERLLNLSSLMELELDFSEEEVEFADRSELMQLLDEAIARTTALSESFRLGDALKNGIPTAIVGAPNSGKSTLLNALTGQDRAIVSPIAGTTRDTIEETCVIDGILFRFIDTAGLRSSADLIEQMGIERTYRELDKARVILLMLDLGRSDEELLQSAREIVGRLRNESGDGRAAELEDGLDSESGDGIEVKSGDGHGMDMAGRELVFILNKADLLGPQSLNAATDSRQSLAEEQNWRAPLERTMPADFEAAVRIEGLKHSLLALSPAAHLLVLSLKTGRENADNASSSSIAATGLSLNDGNTNGHDASHIPLHADNRTEDEISIRCNTLDDLKGLLGARFRDLAGRHDTLVSNLRHANALREAAQALVRTRDGLTQGIPTDLCCQDLRLTLHHLGTITGQITTQEVLNNIFSRFCIGK